MNTIDEMIEVLQEFKKNGNKNIEVKHGDKWRARGLRSGFNFSAFEYRIKRQPQEITLWRHKKTGGVGTEEYFFKLHGSASRVWAGDYELVTFREVIKEK